MENDLVYCTMKASYHASLSLSFAVVASPDRSKVHYEKNVKTAKREGMEGYNYAYVSKDAESR
jgi:hypothetical protein